MIQSQLNSQFDLTVKLVHFNQLFLFKWSKLKHLTMQRCWMLLDGVGCCHRPIEATSFRRWLADGRFRTVQLPFPKTTHLSSLFLPRVSCSNVLVNNVASQRGGNQEGLTDLYWYQLSCSIRDALMVLFMQYTAARDLNSKM